MDQRCNDAEVDCDQKCVSEATWLRLLLRHKYRTTKTTTNGVKYERRFAHHHFHRGRRRRCSLNLYDVKCKYRHASNEHSFIFQKQMVNPFALNKVMPEFSPCSLHLITRKHKLNKIGDAQSTLFSFYIHYNFFCCLLLFGVTISLSAHHSYVVDVVFFFSFLLRSYPSNCLAWL